MTRDRGLEGGQGRSVRDLRRDSRAFAWCVRVVVTLALLAWVVGQCIGGES
jgi:hypothetical protein